VVINISLDSAYCVCPQARTPKPPGVGCPTLPGGGAVAAARKEILMIICRDSSPELLLGHETGQIMVREQSMTTHHFETLIAHVIPETIVSLLTVAGVFRCALLDQPTLALYTLVPIPP